MGREKKRRKKQKKKQEKYDSVPRPARAIYFNENLEPESDGPSLVQKFFGLFWMFVEYPKTMFVFALSILFVPHIWKPIQDEELCQNISIGITLVLVGILACAHSDSFQSFNDLDNDY